MHNLLPREAYDKDETGFWTRLPILMGGFFGTFMALFTYFNLAYTPNLLYKPTAKVVLLSGLLSGLFVGLGYTFAMRQLSRRNINWVYIGDTRAIATPDKPYIYRLLCTWIHNEKNIGGVLFLGKSGFLFVPHRFNRKVVEPFEIGPTAEIEIELSQAPVSSGWLKRLFLPHQQRPIQIRWGSENARFAVPSAENTILLLRRAIDELKRT
jgi:hypothetical protein